MVGLSPFLRLEIIGLPKMAKLIGVRTVLNNILRFGTKLVPGSIHESCLESRVGNTNQLKLQERTSSSGMTHNLESAFIVTSPKINFRCWEASMLGGLVDCA